jgi:inosine-uridine nucleoside N-ribohydrolase
LSYALASGDKLEILGVTIIPYEARHQPISVTEGVEKSYSETLKILKIFGAKIPVFKGATEFMTNQIKDNQAVGFIKKTVEEHDDLIIVCIGALTNLATFIKLYPHLAKRLNIYWLGTGHIVQKHIDDTNSRDIKALKIVLKSKATLTIFPRSLHREMATSLWELEGRMKKNPINDYLISRAKNFYYIEKNGGRICLHDIVPLAFITNQEKFQHTMIKRPKVKNNKMKYPILSFEKVRYVYGIARHQVFKEVFERYNRFGE